MPETSEAARQKAVRLAQSLRENLKRRKQQARARRAGEAVDEAPGSPASEGELRPAPALKPPGR